MKNPYLSFFSCEKILSKALGENPAWREVGKNSCEADFPVDDDVRFLLFDLL